MGVAHDFFKARMAGDRCDLMRATTRLGQPNRRCFTQPVEGTVVQVGHVALFAEPIAETSNSKGFAELRDQKAQMPTRGGVNDRAQDRMDWDAQLDPGSALRLSSDPIQCFVAHVLWSHPN